MRKLSGLTAAIVAMALGAAPSAVIEPASEVGQTNGSAITQGPNTATGGDANSSGGNGGNASTGNTQVLTGNSAAVSLGGDAESEGGDTYAKSGDANGGEGGSANANGGDGNASNNAYAGHSNEQAGGNQGSSTPQENGSSIDRARTRRLAVTLTPAAVTAGTPTPATRRCSLATRLPSLSVVTPVRGWRHLRSQWCRPRWRWR